MKKSKITAFLGLVLTTLLATSIGYFAYWQSIKVNNGNADGNISIGEGSEVTTDVNISNATDNKKLIPSNFSPKSDETNKSVLTFQVTWTSKGAETAEATLEVTYSLSALDPVYEKLLEIDVLYNTAITLDGSAVTVTVEISLIEPENKLEYDVIANQDIVIPFTFKVLV